MRRIFRTPCLVGELGWAIAIMLVPNVVSLVHGDETVAVVHLPPTDRPATLVEQMVEKADPERDEWESESLGLSASNQLKKLARIIERPQQIDSEKLSGFVAEGFSCQSLRPQDLPEVFRDDRFQVRRWHAVAGAAADDSSPSFHGVVGLVDAMKALVSVLGTGADVRIAFKLAQIELSSDSFTTHVLFEASGGSAIEPVQQTGHWLVRWVASGAEGLARPRLAWIGLDRYEQVNVSKLQGQLFRDSTVSALGANPSYRRQLLPGISDWATRSCRVLTMSIFGHNGVAVGDVNGDGLEDLYLCETGGLPNRLFIQNRDGTLADVSEPSGVNWLENSSAALMIDLDNDGDQDLVVATFYFVLFSENDGQGRFTLRQRIHTPAESVSLCAADYDADRDLDVYVCAYYDDQTDRKHPIPYQDANNGGPNAMLRNEGRFRFVDATSLAGLDQNNTRFSFAGAWEDYDNDGDPDLYVANDFGRNNLYRNDGGRFTDVAAAAGVEDIASGMSVTWGDYNRDGHMDVYISNMFSAAGNRVTYQRQFLDRRSDESASHLQRMARGNTLFAGSGDGTFRDVSEPAAVTMGRWAWSSRFIDLNNDSWQDLVVANGYFTNQDTADL